MVALVKRLKLPPHKRGGEGERCFTILFSLPCWVLCLGFSRANLNALCDQDTLLLQKQNLLTPLQPERKLQLLSSVFKAVPRPAMHPTTALPGPSIFAGRPLMAPRAPCTVPPLGLCTSPFFCLVCPPHLLPSSSSALTPPSLQ